jgi:hypothetical protein
MSATKRYTKKELPPCPDLRLFTLVKSKDGLYHWRHKRGTIKPATLNASFAENAELTRIFSPVCKKLTAILRPFTFRMKTPTLHNDLLTGLKRYYKQNKRPGYQLLKDLELQPASPLGHMLQSPIHTRVEDDKISIEFSVGGFDIHQTGPLLTEYYFEAILISGNILDQELEDDSQQSQHFSFNDRERKDCLFEFNRPKDTDWILLLGISCFEGKQPAAHPKYYPMRILETGMPLSDYKEVPREAFVQKQG